MTSEANVDIAHNETSINSSNKLRKLTATNIKWSQKKTLPWVRNISPRGATMVEIKEKKLEIFTLRILEVTWKWLSGHNPW